MEKNMEKYIKDLEDRLNLFEDSYNEMVDVNCDILKKFNEYMGFIAHHLTNIRWTVDDISHLSGFEEVNLDDKPVEQESYDFSIGHTEMKEILFDFEQIKRHTQSIKDKTSDLSSNVLKMYKQHQNGVSDNKSADIIKKGEINENFSESR